MLNDKVKPSITAQLQGEHPRNEEGRLKPLLVPAKTAAAICGKSLRTWRTWDALGLIPRPVRIKRSTLWRLDELKLWTDAGCPARQEWELRSHGKGLAK
jgi:hypothetical protein